MCKLAWISLSKTIIYATIRFYLKITTEKKAYTHSSYHRFFFDHNRAQFWDKNWEKQSASETMTEKQRHKGESTL